MLSKSDFILLHLYALCLFFFVVFDVEFETLNMILDSSLGLWKSDVAGLGRSGGTSWNIMSASQNSMLANS